jgi:membrane associated rhomboid family serine protease
MAPLARVIFLAVGIFLLFMAIVSGVYSYFYFQDHLQLAPDGPLTIFQITMICTVLGLIGGLAIGMYVEAWRAKRGQSSIGVAGSELEPQ